jgi:hypothetical protein
MTSEEHLHGELVAIGNPRKPAFRLKKEDTAVAATAGTVVAAERRTIPII